MDTGQNINTLLHVLISILSTQIFFAIFGSRKVAKTLRACRHVIYFFVYYNILVRIFTRLILMVKMRCDEAMRLDG